MEMVRLLLSRGADPKLATYSGKTVLGLTKQKDMLSFLTGKRNFRPPLSKKSFSVDRVGKKKSGEVGIPPPPPPDSFFYKLECTGRGSKFFFFFPENMIFLYFFSPFGPF